MIVKLFMPRFARLVKCGRKTMTIRPQPWRMPRVGEVISLREWTGKPYRSKQRVLKESVVKQVEQVQMNTVSMIVGDRVLVGDELFRFAFADGFESAGEMFDWFAKTHGLPFRGVAIYWWK